jgi:hypothetical protein
MKFKHLLYCLFLLTLSAPEAWADSSQKTTDVSAKPQKIESTSLIEATNANSIITNTKLVTESTVSIQNNKVVPVLQLSEDPSEKLETLRKPTVQPISQVTSISQLSDVRSTDWAFTSLQSLVERYGCIAGFPDRNFRGIQSITRYEFAAGLNACADKINEIISSGLADKVSKEDLVVLSNLQASFASELAGIRGRVDSLEFKTNKLEAQQFSPTTKFGGEAIFALATGFGGNAPGGLCSSAIYQADNPPCPIRQNPGNNTILTHLVRLGLETTFTGEDRLRTYLTTGNSTPAGFANPAAFDTNMARTSYQAGLENKFILDLLEYRFPVLDKRAIISIIPVGFSLSSVLAPNSGYFDTGRGALSSFTEVSPIFKIGGGSANRAGVGFDLSISESARLQVAYGAGNSNDPTQGVTGSNRSVLGVNLLLKPVQNIIAGLTYVNAYSSDGRLGTFTGSVNADSSGRFSGGFVPINGEGIPLLPIGDLPAQTNAIGASLQWRITPQLTFGTSAALTFTNYLQAVRDYFKGDGTIGSGDKPFANTATYLFSLGLSDPFGREGDLFAILIGMPPKLIDAGPTVPGLNVPFSEISRAGESGVPITDGVGNLQSNTVFGKRDPATSMHYEMFYRFQVTDRISITPGVFVVTNPGGIAGNNAVWIGTIRTTFRF